MDPENVENANPQQHPHCAMESASLKEVLKLILIARSNLELRNSVVSVIHIIIPAQISHFDPFACRIHNRHVEQFRRTRSSRQGIEGKDRQVQCIPHTFRVPLPTGLRQLPNLGYQAASEPSVQQHLLGSVDGLLHSHAYIAVEENKHGEMDSSPPEFDHRRRVENAASAKEAVGKACDPATKKAIKQRLLCYSFVYLPSTKTTAAQERKQNRQDSVSRSHSNHKTVPRHKETH
mmetsp:Transcript_19076/g.52581  ORF Transcript_19076/g.52581 Transcript_19076/m.52581 type:complete len:234 (+) Transcript_19076:956-1657(+)